MNPDIIPDEPLQWKLVRNSVWLYFFTFLIAPAGYIIKLIVARELSVEDIGLFYSILWLIGIISTYNDLGLTEALQYYIPHYLIDKEYAKAKTVLVFTRLMQFLSGILISGILYLGSDWIALHYFKTDQASLLLKYFSIYFIIINLFQVIQSLFIATQKVKRSQGIDVIRMRTIVILTVVSAYWWLLTVYTFTQWRLMGIIAAILCSRRWLKKNFLRLFRDYPIERNKQLIQKQRSYGLRILIGAGAGALLWQINQQIALYAFWARAAWYRTNYLSFYTIVGTITGPIISYLFPLLNELYKKGESDKIKLLYRILFSWTILFWIIGWIGWYFFAEPVSVLLFGEQFRQSGILFQHYAPFVITIPLIGILFQDIASRGMVRQRVHILVAALIVNSIASILFGKWYGLTGLVYAQLCGNIVMVLYGWYRYHRWPHTI